MADVRIISPTPPATVNLSQVEMERRPRRKGRGRKR